MRSIKLPSWIERLTGLGPLPVPPRVFAVDRRGLSYAGFARRAGGFEIQSANRVSLPDGTFQDGLVGGPVKEVGALEGALASLLESAGEPLSEASLILPDAWLRVTFVEIGDLPAKPEAQEEVLRWKLKRLVPFRVEDLRIAATEVAPLPGQEEPRRLLVGFALESLLAQLETIFDRAGIRIGQVTNASLSLIAVVVRDGGSNGSLEAVALVDDEGYTLAFTRGNQPLLHRFKGFAERLPEAARASFIRRDLKLTSTFLEDHFPEARLERVRLAAALEEQAMWSDLLVDGLGGPVEPVDDQCLPIVVPEVGMVPPFPWRDLAAWLGAAATEVL